MTHLPVTHMTLYKHGVGFYERRSVLQGEQVEISFRMGEMNDVLKSLTAIDWGGGQVLGIDYATPQSSHEMLAGCSVRLADHRSFRDLVTSLRGRHVRLLLGQGERMSGTLLGLDEELAPATRAGLTPAPALLVSLLIDGTNQVRKLDLDQVQGVDVLDERGANDLRYFLKASLAQEERRLVTIRLTPGEHDLSVSYVAPAPVWRASYRLVVRDGEVGREDQERDALLQGWGIFDNRLEEDLTDISLSLVAGMPFSFVYDLYTPVTPQRPVVEEEGRVAAALVEFDGVLREGHARSLGLMDEPSMAKEVPVGRAAYRTRAAIGPEAMAQAAPTHVQGQDMGELFEYKIDTPVSVDRGKSAMVPILSSNLRCRKDLLYNGRKFAAHPVATLRLENGTGLSLERGPVLVMEGGAYIGEALLPLTAAGGELVVPYAVELGVKVSESSGSTRQIHSLLVKGSLLHIEEWDIRHWEYQLNSGLAEPVPVLVEHPRTAGYDLFDTPEPREQTAEHFRFKVNVPAWGETILKVQERRLLSRREELQKQSFQGLQRYLRQGLIDEATHAQVAGLLKMWERLSDVERLLKEVDEGRQRVFGVQQQIQGNMSALSTTGKEGTLRARYVEQLEASEDKLRELDAQESTLREERGRLEGEIGERLQALE